jgi:hypothetical protein
MVSRYFVMIKTGRRYVSRISQLVGLTGQNTRLIPYGNYVHNEYLDFDHYQGYPTAGN